MGFDRPHAECGGAFPSAALRVQDDGEEQATATAKANAGSSLRSEWKNKSNSKGKSNSTHAKFGK
jgi:hypothetical protein